MNIKIQQEDCLLNYWNLNEKIGRHKIHGDAFANGVGGKQGMGSI